jgi:hypothetical protein
MTVARNATQRFSLIVQCQKESEWVGIPMGPRASDDWPEEYIIVVPHYWRDDNLSLDIQVEA